MFKCVLHVRHQLQWMGYIDTINDIGVPGARQPSFPIESLSHLRECHACFYETQNASRKYVFLVCNRQFHGQK